MSSSERVDLVVALLQQRFISPSQALNLINFNPVMNFVDNKLLYFLPDSIHIILELE